MALRIKRSIPVIPGLQPSPSWGLLFSKYGGFLMSLLMNLSCLTTASGQSKTVHSSQQWMQLNTQTELSRKITLQMDVSIRQTEGGTQPLQRLFQAGLGYGQPEKLRAVTAISRIHSIQEGRISRKEWRGWQELSRTHEFSGFSLQHRIRAEARWLESRSATGLSSEHSFTTRLRYRLLSMIPLAKLGSQEPKSATLSLSVSDELFFNTTLAPGQHRFDNNRFAAGPSLRFNPALSMAFLYNYQYGHRNSKQMIEAAEICWLTVSWKGRVSRTDKAGRL